MKTNVKHDMWVIIHYEHSMKCETWHVNQSMSSIILVFEFVDRGEFSSHIYRLGRISAWIGTWHVNHHTLWAFHEMWNITCESEYVEHNFSFHIYRSGRISAWIISLHNFIPCSAVDMGSVSYPKSSWLLVQTGRQQVWHWSQILGALWPLHHKKISVSWLWNKCETWHVRD